MSSSLDWIVGLYIWLNFLATHLTFPFQGGFEPYSSLGIDWWIFQCCRPCIDCHFAHLKAAIWIWNKSLFSFNNFLPLYKCAIQDLHRCMLQSGILFISNLSVTCYLYINNLLKAIVYVCHLEFFICIYGFTKHIFLVWVYSHESIIWMAGVIYASLV